MKRLVLGMLIILSPVRFAEAQTGSAGVFNLVFENDAFADTDYHYTSGILLNYVTSTAGTPNRLRQFARSLPEVDSDDKIYTGFHLGQQIFTPQNIRTSELLHDQRPYAGYLYGGISLLAANSHELNAWKLSVGVVGPGAYAQQSQTSIHNRVGANVAEGWDNQLGSETIMQFDYYKSWRRLWNHPGGRYEADLMPYAGFALGNAAVHGDAGFTLRIGHGMSNDFGPPRMRPSLPGSAFLEPSGRWGWYFFLGAGGRYVAHNIFLDGNTQKESHSVEKYNWVGDMQAGWVLNTDGYRLTWTFVNRSREYQGQKVGDNFGSLTLSFGF